MTTTASYMKPAGLAAGAAARVAAMFWPAHFPAMAKVSDAGLVSWQQVGPSTVQAAAFAESVRRARAASGG